jgi:hypothetical protein
MDQDVRERVADLVRDDIARFRELTGRDFSSWSV